MKIPALVAIDPDFWPGRRVLLTGHTGFKGAWLSLWLQSLGAELVGLAPGAPTRPSLYEQARVAAGMRELAGDVRDRAAVARATADADPEIVVHMAAQPMVRRSLLEPALTYEVNVMGTVNVLDAVRLHAPRARAVLVVTSDKCYENDGAGRPFREGDPLGGADPYSSSKACAELVTAAYRRSFHADGSGPRLATARAGNVIGGGDWGQDRLIPDAVRAVERDEPLLVRNPDAVRPWQHVLNPLCGYLQLIQALWQGTDAARAWNFGPPPSEALPVRRVLDRLAELWDGRLQWRQDAGRNPPEARLLSLDSTDAARDLGWSPRWDLDRSLVEIVAWHRSRSAGVDARELTLRQVEAFLG